MLPLLLVLLYCTSPAVAAEMTLHPDSQTVLSGEETRFTCSTKHPQWGAMIWQVNGKTVLTVSQQSGLVPSTNPNITAEKSSSSSHGDGWTLVLSNTRRQHQGEVTCDLQEVSKKTARLFVQEKGSVRISGESRLALKGHSVEFECQAAGWSPQPTLHWRVNNREVSGADYNLSSVVSGAGQFSVSSNLSVTASSSSDIHCLVSVSAMKTPLHSAVRLTVVAEVLEEEEGCTVAVAILGSLSALLLLALLCICTVLWLRRRPDKPGLQQPIWFSQSESGRISVAGGPQGKVNPGYSSDRDPYLNDLIIGPPIPITTSLDKVPDVVSSSSQSFQSDSSEKSIKNVRSVTTV